MVGRRITLILAAALMLPVGPSRRADAQGSRPGPPAAHAFARHVPERFDDIAWENDRIAFRIYGPALERREQTGSGVDVWAKSTRKLVIDRWYKSGDYHKDHGEGLDYYGVGQGRGCGGLGIWNGKSLDVSRVWESFKILESGPDRASFEVTYAPWKSGGQDVRETRRIALEAGSNLSRIESTIRADRPDELTVGLGISKRKGEGKPLLDKGRGLASYWEPPAGPNGSIACGILADPARVVDVLEADGHYLVLVRVTPGRPFVYYAGAGWSKSGDFATPTDWERYLREYPTRFKAD